MLCDTAGSNLPNLLVCKLKDLFISQFICPFGLAGSFVLYLIPGKRLGEQETSQKFLVAMTERKHTESLALAIKCFSTQGIHITLHVIGQNLACESPMLSRTKNREYVL